MPQRLPIVDSDDGVWGDIIRQYLMKEHFNDDTDNAENGGHQKVTIRAGTTDDAPLKFTSGSLLTSPQAGAVEFLGDSFYATQTTSATRKKIAIYDDSAGATGDLYFRNSSGYFARLGIGSTGDHLAVISGIPSWTALIVGKVIDNTNTVTVTDTLFTVQHNGDVTKQMRFQLSGLTTSTVRTLTVPDANTTIVGTDTSQTLTGKAISGSANTLTALPYDFSVMGFGQATTRAAGTGDFPLGVKLQRACTLSSVTYRCVTADASGNLVVELRKNGVAVSGSSATIAAVNQLTGGTATGTWSFAAGDILTIQITGVGTTPGKGLIADIAGITA